jgi:hypothetical protein
MPNSKGVTETARLSRLEEEEEEVLQIIKDFA